MWSETGSLNDKARFDANGSMRGQLINFKHKKKS